MCVTTHPSTHTRSSIASDSGRDWESAISVKWKLEQLLVGAALLHPVDHSLLPPRLQKHTLQSDYAENIVHTNSAFT